MKHNDVGIRPSKNQLTIGDSLVIHYLSDDSSSKVHHVRRAHASILISELTQTVVWPGSFLELNIPDESHPSQHYLWSQELPAALLLGGLNWEQ